MMRRLDRSHLECPFAGSTMVRGLLPAEGCKIRFGHVKTEPLYRRPRTTNHRPKPPQRSIDTCLTGAYGGKIRSRF